MVNEHGIDEEIEQICDIFVGRRGGADPTDIPFTEVRKWSSSALQRVFEQVMDQEGTDDSLSVSEGALGDSWGEVEISVDPSFGDHHASTHGEEHKSFQIGNKRFWVRAGIYGI